MKICDICGIKPATIHFKKLVNGKLDEQNVCADCSGKLQIFNIGDLAGGQSFALDPSQFIASLLKSVGGKPSAGGKRSQAPARQCSCGLSEIDLRQNLKFGCAVCYDTFRDIVESFLAVHMPGVHSHRGKGVIEGVSELEKLHAELKAAVGREDYETAAALKRRINELN